MEFWEAFTAMREQKRKKTLPASMKLGDNQYWHPKYTDEEILDKIFRTFTSIGPVTDSATDEEILDLMDEWDETWNDDPER